jgi:hypothetical protein
MCQCGCTYSAPVLSISRVAHSMLQPRSDGLSGADNSSAGAAKPVNFISYPVAIALARHLRRSGPVRSSFWRLFQLVMRIDEVRPKRRKSRVCGNFDAQSARHGGYRRNDGLSAAVWPTSGRCSAGSLATPKRTSTRQL